MKEDSIRLGPREQQIAELLLQGCDNDAIAKQLNMARRTVKAHFNRLFMRFGITSGIKRVKLATILYRRQICSEESGMEAAKQIPESNKSLNSLPRDSKTEKLQMPLEPPSTLSKTIYESSMTSSDSGTGSNLLSGTKRASKKALLTPEVLESWEQSILSLDRSVRTGHDLSN
jgi:IS30 family transposase